jgi:hypothetical protein
MRAELDVPGPVISQQFRMVLACRHRHPGGKLGGDMVSILVSEPMGQGAQPFIDPIPEPAAFARRVASHARPARPFTTSPIRRSRRSLVRSRELRLKHAPS